MRRRSIPSVVVLVAAVLVLQACFGQTVTVSRNAVRQAAPLLDTTVAVVEFSADDVVRFSRQADVSEQVIRESAESLDAAGAWHLSMENLTRVYQVTPPELRGPLLGVACDGISGQIQTREDLDQAIIARVQSLGYPPEKQYGDAVVQLWSDLEQAMRSPNPDFRAAAVLTCATIENVAGAG